MTRSPLGLLLVAGLVLVSPAALWAPTDANQHAAPVQVDNCRVITEPGAYALASDIRNGGRGGNFTFASQTCLRIESDDVVLYGRGHRVDGLGNSDTTGIGVVGDDGTVENVTITNVTVTDWNRGIYFNNSYRGTVRDASLARNAYGMSIEGSSSTRLTRVNVRENLIGVYEGGTSNNTLFSANTFEGNYAGDVVSDAEKPNAEMQLRSRGRPSGSGDSAAVASSRVSDVAAAKNGAKAA